MDDLTSKIKRRIKGSVAVVGIGNPLRGDDGFGPKLIEALNGRVEAAVFDCGTAPENYIIPILSSNPGTIILLDACDFNGSPGEARVFDIEEISSKGLAIHDISPRLIADLFKTGDSKINIFMVAIQPKDTSFGSALSGEIRAGIERLQKILSQLLCQ